MERLLPWIQGFFQIGYIFLVGGRTMVDLGKVERVADLGLVPWLVPPFWFAAPLELLAVGPSAAVFGRLSLAVATVGLLVGGAARWLGPGLTERLLEPAPEPAKRSRRIPEVPARPVTALRRTAGSERGRLLAMLRVHLRSDWRTRSEFLVIPLLGVFLLLFYFRDQGSISKVWFPTLFYSWFLLLSGDVLTRTSRPESLWWILTAPIDRTRFSWATLSLMRAFQLAPLFVATVLAQALNGGISWQDQIATAVELLALGDLLVLVGKGMFPDFPFSRPRAQGATGERTALTLVGGFVSSLATGLVLLFGLGGIRGILAGAATFALLRIPAARWARRRTAEAAERLELLGGV